MISGKHWCATGTDLVTCPFSSIRITAACPDIGGEHWVLGHFALKNIRTTSRDHHDSCSGKDSLLTNPSRKTKDPLSGVFAICLNFGLCSSKAPVGGLNNGNNDAKSFFLHVTSS
jgi:hypothetical protein